MIKYTVLLSALLLSVVAPRWAFALDGHIETTKPEQADYFSMAFSSAPNSTVAGDLNFSGHATDMSVIGNSASPSGPTFSANFYRNKNSVDASSMTIIGNQAWSESFYAPASSPTIVTYSIPAGTTFHIKVGGLKTDK